MNIAPPRLDGPGTPEADWQRCQPLLSLPSWRPEPPPSGRVVVVAPHPDDEILGAGGTLALLSAAGTRIELLAVTDGEKSHPGQEDLLQLRRPRESAAAAARLGLSPITTRRLGHPDGEVDEDRLYDELLGLVGPGDLLLAPWWRDGHPDHDRVGGAASAVGHRLGVDTLAYLVWTWHWAGPATEIPWSKARKVWLGRHITMRKGEAVRCFESQIAGPDPILPDHVVVRLTRSFEVLLWP